jgi:hypothetical protein
MAGLHDVGNRARQGSFVVSGSSDRSRLAESSSHALAAGLRRYALSGDRHERETGSPLDFEVVGSWRRDDDCFIWLWQ